MASTIGFILCTKSVMRDVKFRYVYQHRTHKDFQYITYSLDDISLGLPLDNGMSDDGYILISKDEDTGQKDKNLKEIHEGDIVKYKYVCGFLAEESLEDGLDGGYSEYIGEVEFDEGRFSPIDEGSYPDDGYYGWRTFDFEVIGNIYENKDLLYNQ